MGGKKPSSRFWAIFNAACGLVTVIGWLGITPGRVGQMAYDVLYPMLPFAAFGFGFLTGFFVRDYAKARDAENAEKMRREREQREKEEERERREREAIEKEAERKQACESRIVDGFKHGNPRMKRYIIEMYKDGSAEMREEDFRTLGLYEWADYETFESEDWHDTHTYVKASLKPDVREVIDRHELIK